LLLQVDSLRNTSESNEDNDVVARPIHLRRRQQADLVIADVVGTGAGPVNDGGIVSWDVTVRNDGPDNVAEAIVRGGYISDPPTGAHLRFDRPASVLSYGGGFICGNGFCRLFDFAPGAVAVVHLEDTAALGDPTTPGYVETILAVVDETDTPETIYDADYANNERDIFTDVMKAPTADLSVVGFEGPSAGVVGDELEFTELVSNAGPDAAQVFLTWAMSGLASSADVVVVAVGSSDPLAVCSQAGGYCTSGLLAAGASVLMTVRFRWSVAGSYL